MEFSDSKKTFYFNENGTLSKVDRYADDVITSSENYTYYDEGYERQYYYYVDEEIYLETFSKYWLYNDGTYEETYYEKDDSGNTTYGSKSVTTADGVHYYYSLDTTSDTYELSYYYIESITTTANDGTVTTIYRSLDDDGNIEYTGKYVSLDTESERLYEYYTCDGEAWIGSYKYRYVYVTAPEFEYTTPSDPKSFDDDFYSTLNPTEATGGDWSYAVATSYYTNEYDYSWDDDSNDWTLSYLYETYTYTTDENVLVKVQNYLNDTYTTTITRDDDHRLVSSVKEHYTFATLDYTSSGTYTYTSSGQLQTFAYGYESTSGYTYSYSYDYHYGTQKVISEVDDIQIDITGADESKVYYNLSGQRVISPSHGIYIEVSGGKSRKVLIK